MLASFEQYSNISKIAFSSCELHLDAFLWPHPAPKGLWLYSSDLYNSDPTTSHANKCRIWLYPCSFWKDIQRVFPIHVHIYSKPNPRRHGLSKLQSILYREPFMNYGFSGSEVFHPISKLSPLERSMDFHLNKLESIMFYTKFDCK